MTAAEAKRQGWQPTANYYAGSQIWVRNGKYGLYSPCLDLLTTI